MLRKFLPLLKKSEDPLEVNTFRVFIETHPHSHFLVKHPTPSYAPIIKESKLGQWSELIKVLRDKSLYLEIFVSNPRQFEPLVCNIKVEEFNCENSILQTSSFEFPVSRNMEEWKWMKFEIKSMYTT